MEDQIHFSNIKLKLIFYVVFLNKFVKKQRLFVILSINSYSVSEKLCRTLPLYLVKERNTAIIAPHRKVLANTNLTYVPKYLMCLDFHTVFKKDHRLLVMGMVGMGKLKFLLGSKTCGSL